MRMSDREGQGCVLWERAPRLGFLHDVRRSGGWGLPGLGGEGRMMGCRAGVDYGTSEGVFTWRLRGGDGGEM